MNYCVKYFLRKNETYTLQSWEQVYMERHWKKSHWLMEQEETVKDS